MFELGERVKIRDRLWRISGIREHEGIYTVEVEGTGENNKLERRSFIYPLEEIERLPSGELNWEIGQPGLWKVLHDSYLLDIVYGPEYLVSLNRARIILEDYQLAAVLKAFRSPRQRILLADDVGLGKTVEAMLILLELMARRRGDRVLIIVPAALTEQWYDELFYKLGLNFEIFDSDYISKFISNLPRNANPWVYCDRIITSIDYVKREDVKRALRDASWDAVIVDEAHYLSESSSGKKSIKTDRSRFGEFISERTDNLIFLTATPHDGYSHSFFSLIRLLDPFLCAQAEDLNRKRVSELVVRRLKNEIRNQDGSPKFQTRNVKTISLSFANPVEKKLYREVCKYADEVWRIAKDKAETITVGFAMAILKRRLISSPESLRISLEHRLENPSEAPADIHSLRGLVADYISGVPLNESQSERAQKTLLSSYILDNIKEEQTSLKGLLKLAQEVNQEVDSKANTLLSFLIGFFKRNPNEKVIIFTEFRDTQNYLMDYLSKRGFKESIALLYGGMSQAQRKDAKNMFHKPSTRILLATDAASEGLNFQEDSSTIIHYELPWNPNRLEQRNGRVDRYGQKQTVNIYNLHLKDTYEAEVLERLKQKILRINEDFGTTSEILGPLSGFNIDDLLMGTGGLKEDLPDVDSKIKHVDEVLDEMVSKSKDILNEWQEKSYIRFSPFGEREREAVRKSVEISKSLLPDYEDLKSLAKFVIENTGGVFKETSIPEIYEIDVSRILQGQDVETFYPCVTFNREIAVANRDLVFLTASHPLIKAILQFVRSQFYEGRKGYRMSYKVVTSGKDPGILFTFIARFMDAKGSLLLESLIPVFVSLSGSPSWKEEDDFYLLKSSGKPLNVPPDLLEREYSPLWKMLLKVAQSVAENRRDLLFEKVGSRFDEYCDRILNDIANWREDSRKVIKKRYGGGVQTTIDRTLPLFRMQYELRLVNEKAEKRENEIHKLRPLRGDKLEVLGALLIVSENMLES